MNTTSNFPVPSLPRQTSIPAGNQSSQPRQQRLNSWQFLPLLITPVLVAGAFYFGNSHAQNTFATERNQMQQSVARSQQQLEDIQTQLDATQQKYQDTLTQLQTVKSQKAVLQEDYTDASIRIDHLELQTQQLKSFKAERDTLKAQAKKLQESNTSLKNQGKSQQEQLKTLQTRIKSLENQKQQLQSNNQKLQQASSQLDALKPELAQAHQTIEQLSLQLGKKSDEMARIKINGQDFTVAPELATALKAERNSTNNPI
ncbi:MAG TPA: hypothetical protein V6C95_14175 [Coleofasciculaceae cyanobacterium]